MFLSSAHKEAKVYFWVFSPFSLPRVPCNQACRRTYRRFCRGKFAACTCQNRLFWYALRNLAARCPISSLCTLFPSCARSSNRTRSRPRKIGPSARGNDPISVCGTSGRPRSGTPSRRTSGNLSGRCRTGGRGTDASWRASALSSRSTCIPRRRLRGPRLSSSISQRTHTRYHGARPTTPCRNYLFLAPGQKLTNVN